MAQTDSLQIGVGTQVTGASRGFQPLWLTANRFGVISNEQVDAATHIYIHNLHTLGKVDTSMAGQANTNLTVGYGVDLYNNQHFGQLIAKELYAKAKFRSVEFKVGRFLQTTGEMDPELSIGSFGISGNALPIPKISLAIPTYVDVPWTKGLFQVKGTFAHGWMGKDRYLRAAYFHEKTFYGRVGRGWFKAYGGLQHFTEWGGHRGNLILDRSFQGFLNVLLIKESYDGSLNADANPNIRPNRSGAQRGLIEMGVDIEREDFNLNVYNQTPIESGTGVDIRNADRLLGATLRFKDEHRFLQKIVVEFLHTTQMEKYGGERQSYYNNGIYATGWEYKDRIIGNSLFINRVQGSEFLPIDPFDWDGPLDRPGNKNIVNNRIMAGHIGLKYRVGEHMMARTMATYSINHGSFQSTDFITFPHKQFYSLQEFTYSINPKWHATASVAFDTGDFYSNFGGMLGFNYVLFGN
ncbi:capsule assembly Wzi family protein [Parapedobacter tibetensis]|uniref:capsule assembly Wzi family protein n=1 Tax=Parapedobacter tibetensis TaxID=2972951 RepID=UPI00214DE3A0|nr:capsule assembly Wzi family protein [Parapedobacter tibetensis]